MPSRSCRTKLQPSLSWYLVHISGSNLFTSRWIFFYIMGGLVIEVKCIAVWEVVCCNCTSWRKSDKGHSCEQSFHSLRIRLNCQDSRRFGLLQLNRQQLSISKCLMTGQHDSFHYFQMYSYDDFPLNQNTTQPDRKVWISPLHYLRCPRGGLKSCTKSCNLADV